MSRTILLTGATGYIGGRLLRRLEREDLTIRCLTRRPEAVERIAALSSEVVVGGAGRKGPKRNHCQELSARHASP